MHTPPAPFPAPTGENIDFSCFPALVTSHNAGLRLDAFLKNLFPGMGIRGVRRLWEWCDVRVNDKRAKTGYFLSAGDMVTLNPLHQNPDKPPTGNSATSSQRTKEVPLITKHTHCSPAQEYIITHSEHWFALHKPHGIHTTHLAGGNQPSLERLMETQWSTWLQEYSLRTGRNAESAGPPRLVTRLDAATAGIVLGTTSPKEEKHFRDLEEQGAIEKTYFALVHGTVVHPFTVNNALDTANRRVTTVLSEPDLNPVRHTRCEPVTSPNLNSLFDLCAAIFASQHTLFSAPLPLRSYLHSSDLPSPKTATEENESFFPDCTLVRVTINKGARHQIRAHLAHAGFPLVGEWLYSTEALHEKEQHIISLWHNHIRFITSSESNTRINIAPPLPRQESTRKDIFLKKDMQLTMPLFLHHAAVCSPLLEAEDTPLWI